MYTKSLVLFAMMMSFARAQELKGFEGVYLSGRDGWHPPVVLKIEQVPNGLKFTEYEMYDIPADPEIHTRTYTINGKYIKNRKEHSKVRVAFKKNKLMIDTVTDGVGVSLAFTHGTRQKRAAEWSLTPDLQTLTLKIREDEQSMEIPVCGGQELCNSLHSLGYADPDANVRSTRTSERLFSRRGLLSAALAEAEKN